MNINKFSIIIKNKTLFESIFWPHQTANGLNDDGNGDGDDGLAGLLQTRQSLTHDKDTRLMLIFS